MGLKNIISTVVLNYLNETYVDQDNNLQDMEQVEINEILKGYVACALSTEQDKLIYDYYVDMMNNDDGKNFDEKLAAIKDNFIKKDSFTFDDFHDDDIIDTYVDIKTFIGYAGDDAILEAKNEYGLFRLGMDIWYTRNGHRAGFFDHNYENRDILIYAAKKLKPKSLYFGDDGKLHFM